MTTGQQQPDRGYRYVESGQVAFDFFNNTADAAPGSWVVGPTKLAKGFYTSLSFDRDCVLYIGGDGGYFTYNFDTGLVDPRLCVRTCDCTMLRDGTL